jgi:thiol-disulfide isomerase/thioredoxin
MVDQTFPKMELIMIDGISNRELAGRFNIFSFPTILVYFDGKEFTRFSQYVSINQIKEKISRTYELFFM